MSLDLYLHCRCCGSCVCEINATHNLTKMAAEALLYRPLWRPDESGIEKAGDLIPALEAGIARMESEPDYFRLFNPENGWGDYDGFLEVLRHLLKGCRDHPEASVYASR